MRKTTKESVNAFSNAIELNNFSHYVKYNVPKDANAEEYVKDYIIDNDIKNKIND